MTASCAQPLPAQAPPATARLYFPAAMAAAPAGDAVYIVNTNFDQRFDGGWVTPLDVATWLQTGDLGAALQAGTPRKTPSLGGRLALSSDGEHAILTHRGVGLLTLLDVAAPPGGGARTQISCGADAAAGMPSSLARIGCGRDHLVDLAAICTQPGGDPSAFRQYQDPFAATALSVAAGVDFVAVGYLGAAPLTVLRVDRTAATPRVTLAGSLGDASLALASLQEAPGGRGRLLGTSRGAEGAAGTSTIYEFDVAGALAAQGGGVARFDVAADVGGTEMTAAVAAPDGGHLYAANHAPDSLVILRRQGAAVADTAAAVAAVPGAGWQVVGAAALDGAEVSDLAYVARPAGDLLVAASLARDTLFFFAPQGDTLALVRRIKLDTAGPAGLLVLPHAGGTLLLVSSFFDHGLRALELSSASPADFHEVAVYHEADLPRAPRHF